MKFVVDGKVIESLREMAKNPHLEKDDSIAATKLGILQAVNRIENNSETLTDEEINILEGHVRGYPPLKGAKQLHEIIKKLKGG